MQPESRAGDIGLMENHVWKTVLQHGLTIVTERIPYVRSVSLGVWIKAGAETDRIENMGMADFIEHMAFKGTETRSAFEIADSIESLGGSLNAFTSRDLTCYYVSIPDEHVTHAVEILADILCHSLFSFEEIEREKCVVIEEILSFQDIPEDLVQDTVGDATLSPDPSSKPVLGTIETVQCFVREDLIKYISSNYS
jgi:predicted Zn-dependent peptidase